MSRHKHRSGSVNTGGNGMMNNSLGINPQILQMLGLGSADMGQLSGLLGNMGQEGFNLNNLGSIANSLGLGNIGGGNNGGNINPLELLGSLFADPNGENNGGNFNSNQNFANSNMNSSMNSSMNSGNNNYTGESDANMAMLKAVRSMVDPQRCKFLDRVMELYKNGEINY